MISVLIPDGESPYATSVVRCLAHAGGLRVSVLSRDRLAPIRFSIHRSRFFAWRDQGDEQAHLTAIADTARRVKADVILPIDRPTIRLLSRRRDAMAGVAALALLPEVWAFDIAANKAVLADWLAREHLPHPASVRAVAGDDPDVAGLTFPVLAKPTESGNGAGIRQCDTAGDLRQFLRSPAATGEYVVQSFIRGYDIDSSVLCRHGKVLAWTVRRTFLDGPTRFGPAAGIEFVEDAAALDVVTRVMQRLRWSGVAHIDMRYDADDRQVKVIEINPRFWGSVLASLTAHVNISYFACLAALGRELPPRDYRPATRYVAGRAALRFLLGQLRGRAGLRVDWRNTSLAYMVWDPLPEILGGAIEIVRRIGA